MYFCRTRLPNEFVFVFYWVVEMKMMIIILVERLN